MIDQERPKPELLTAAVSDREQRPWRYYRLDHDTMKKLLEEAADQIVILRAALQSSPSREEREQALRESAESAEWGTTVSELIGHAEECCWRHAGASVRDIVYRARMAWHHASIARRLLKLDPTPTEGK